MAGVRISDPERICSTESFNNSVSKPSIPTLVPAQGGVVEVYFVGTAQLPFEVQFILPIYHLLSM